MNDRKARELFVLLYETAGSAGIEVIEDRLNRRGGVCRVDGRVHVIYDEQAPYREKNRLILEAITRTDCDAAYLPPKVRNLIAGQGVMVDIGQEMEVESSREEGSGQTEG
ncbi:MAG TPA: hypothetical protein PLR71_14280 [Deltaproteobacteria bacterium]|nr:hypothetical protein [Deltaproteobacteria bacterium]HQI82713.1 hypothetical protein [Deltaproteobacteria bacterium]